jgi:hypothetical protein
MVDHFAASRLDEISLISDSGESTIADKMQPLKERYAQARLEAAAHGGAIKQFQRTMETDDPETSKASGVVNLSLESLELNIKGLPRGRALVRE